MEVRHSSRVCAGELTDWSRVQQLLCGNKKESLGLCTDWLVAEEAPTGIADHKPLQEVDRPQTQSKPPFESPKC